MTETPSEEVDADLDDPIEPRMNPAEDPIEGDGDGDDTLVSEGNPPSTANDRPFVFDSHFHSRWLQVAAAAR